MIADGPEYSSMELFRAGMKSNVELDCFPIVTSSCCDICRGKNQSRIRHVSSVRKPRGLGLSTMENIRQWGRIKIRTSAYQCQDGVSRDNLISSLRYLRKNTVIKERRTTRGLPKEAQSEASLSKRR